MTDEEYEASVRAIESMVSERRKHTTCAKRACMGPASMPAFLVAAAVDPAWPAKLVPVAVAMLAEAAIRAGELDRLLEIQRGMTADAAACAMRVDADLVDAHGRIADLEQRVASLTAELTLWEEST
jgi:hypothetical protein